MNMLNILGNNFELCGVSPCLSSVRVRSVVLVLLKFRYDISLILSVMLMVDLY